MPWISASRLGKDRPSYSYQQDTPTLHRESGDTRAAAFDSTPSPPATFQFGYKRQPIDWRILHGVDIERLVRETDIDTLERCVAAVAFGDLEAEDLRSLTEVNLMRIFRLGQLTNEYLLHVQDRLAYDNCLLKERKAQGEKHVKALQLRCKEHKAALTSAKQDTNRLKKTVSTLENVVPNMAASPSVPAPAPAPANPSAGSRAAWKVERLERQVRELQEERSTLLQDLSNLKMSLASHASLGKEEADAVAAEARAQERQHSRRHAQQLQDQIQDLRRKLQISHARRLLLQKAKDSTAADLEEHMRHCQQSHTDISTKRQRQEHDLLAVKADLLKKERELDELSARSAAEAAKADQIIKKLEQKLDDAVHDLDATSAAAKDVSGLQEDIKQLKDKVKRLKDEHDRIKTENNELKRSKSDMDARTQDLHRSLRAERRKEEEAEVEEQARASATAPARQRSASAPPGRPSPIRTREDDGPAAVPASLGRPWAVEDAPSNPVYEEQMRWRRERPHELRPYDRPGVLSRTRIPRDKFLASRPEIEELLEGELTEELLSFGIDPKAGRLSQDDYQAALEELQNRQAATAADSSPAVAARIKTMRQVLLWHLHSVADGVDREYTIMPNGQVAASSGKRPAQTPQTVRTGTATPKKSSLLLKLCNRFKSPSKSRQGRRDKARLDQAAAVAAYRETYGHDPLGLGVLPTSRLQSPSPAELEKRKLKADRERFYSPLRTGSVSLSQEMSTLTQQLPSPSPTRSPHPRQGRSKLADPRPSTRRRARSRSSTGSLRLARAGGEWHAGMSGRPMETFSLDGTHSEYEEDMEVAGDDVDSMGPRQPVSRQALVHKAKQVREVELERRDHCPGAKSPISSEEDGLELQEDNASVIGLDDAAQRTL